MGKRKKKSKSEIEEIRARFDEERGKKGQLRLVTRNTKECSAVIEETLP